MKIRLLSSFGAVGGFIAAQLGGWDYALQALVICMAVDYATGFIVAAVFKKSKKSDTGALNSNAGFKGLIKKGVMLLIVLIGYRLDYVIGTELVRMAVIVGFLCNELISITENAGLMGIKAPSALKKAILILNRKGENADANNTTAKPE
jgi:toxin secretion/phage lysis holin